MLFEDVPFGPYDNAEHKALRAFELYEEGEIPQALLELESALQLNPSNSALHFNKALALDTVSHFEDAIGEYEIALQLNPCDLEILNSLAVDYTRIGQYDLAVNTFEYIQELDGEFEPCYCNRIITYTEMGQHDLAEQMFYLAQQLDPNCALCFYNIGNSLFARGQYKKAVHCWLKTAELDPSHPEINYRIAQAYWSDGDVEHTRGHLLAELRINPGNIDVIFDFGLFLLQVGDIESAKEKFNRILELKPDFAPAAFYLGEIAFDGADYELAVQLFNEALKIDDSLPGPRFRLAQHQLKAGNKEQARAYLAAEMKLASESADILTSMGSMFLEIEDIDLAAHCLLRAVDLDCANADAYYYLGQVSVANGRLDDASDFFGHALDIRPDDVDFLRDSAVVCLMRGKVGKSAKRIKKALALTQNQSAWSGDYSFLKAIFRRIWLVQKAEQITKFLYRLRRRFTGKKLSSTVKTRRATAKRRKMKFNRHKAKTPFIRL